MSAPFFSLKPDQFQHVVDRLLALRGGNLVTRAEEIQVLRHFHVLVHAEEIRHVTDDMAHGVGVAHDIVAEDLGRAGGGREKRGEDAQRGGLARAVGADEAEEIAAVDGQVERTERGHGAVRAGQADGVDGGNGGAESAAS